MTVLPLIPPAHISVGLLGFWWQLTRPVYVRCLLSRYLFVRCDNSPAPWTSDETGDSKRLDVPELAAKEIKQAQGQVFAMSDKPFW